MSHRRSTIIGCCSFERGGLGDDGGIIRYFPPLQLHMDLSEIVF